MEIVSRWLEPRDLAVVALTSREMAAAARALSSLREADAAQGMERFVVPVVNRVDGCRYPYFEYSPVPVAARPCGEIAAFSFPPGRCRATGFDFGRFEDDGCGCIECCRELPVCFSQDGRTTTELVDQFDEARTRKRKRAVSRSCPCGRTVSGKPAYDPSTSRLLCFREQEEPNSSAPPPDDLPLIYECGPACSCKPDCQHRLSQRGLSVKVEVAKHPTKGWSLVAAQDITAGAFLCEYAGELLTTKEAQRRHRDYDKSSKATSLLVVREHLPSGQACLRFNIDATNVGNVARFINHSCDGGNLLSCLVRTAGCCVPRLAFFARRDIHSGQELTFSYGVVEPGRESSSKACFCGTSQCRGILPSEET